MACRCKDMEEYRIDLVLVREAIGHANTLCSAAGTVRESIDSLATDYAQTLNVEDGFYAQLNKLDEGAQAKASAIRNKLFGCERTLYEKLKQASAEDNAWDGEHDN